MTLDSPPAHCPTCGSTVDHHALMIMDRNRHARDAQFRQLIASLDAQPVDRGWQRFEYSTIAILAIICLTWMIWVSAAVIDLQASR